MHPLLTTRYEYVHVAKEEGTPMSALKSFRDQLVVHGKVHMAGSRGRDMREKIRLELARARIVRSFRRQIKEKIRYHFEQTQITPPEKQSLNFLPILYISVQTCTFRIEREEGEISGNEMWPQRAGCTQMHFLSPSFSKMRYEWGREQPPRGRPARPAGHHYCGKLPSLSFARSSLPPYFFPPPALFSVRL